MDRRATPERLTHQDGTPVRVLVVDDEPMLGDLLSTALRYEGWQVETALNGRTAVRTAASLDPDVVVLDVLLPDMSGLDVLRRLREARPRIPVLFLTARDAVEDRIAVRPFRAVSTCQPSYRSAVESRSPSIGSSSTTRTRTGEPSSRVRRSGVARRSIPPLSSRRVTPFYGIPVSRLWDHPIRMSRQLSRKPACSSRQVRRYRTTPLRPRR